MSIVKIRLQKRGGLRNPRFWIIVQASHKNPRGLSFIERIGYLYLKKRATVDRAIVLNFHRTRHWLMHNAQPTRRIHRILATAGLLPKPPIPFGAKYTYEKPKTPIDPKFYDNLAFGYNGHFRLNEKNDFNKQFDNFVLQNLHHLSKLTAEDSNGSINNLLKDSGELSIENFQMNSKKLEKYIRTDIDTELINSDEVDFPKRKRYFEILTKKLKNYFDNNFHVYQGRDVHFQAYQRKLDKMSKRNGIDEETYKEFEKILLFEKEKNDLLKVRLTYKFETEYRQNQEYKEKFFKYFNNGEVNEEVFNDFAEKEISKIYRMVNKQVDDYFKNFEEKTEILSSVFSNKNETNSILLEDLTCLRFAKLMKKLREGYLYNISKMPNIKIQASVGKGSNTKSENDSTSEADKLSKGFSTNLPKMANQIKRDFISIIEQPVIDSHLLNIANKKFINDKGLHINYFNHVNKLIVNSKTFKKFEDRLMLLKNTKTPDLFGEENNTQEKSKLEDIYNLNDIVIDDLCRELEFILTKNYELNDIYNDKYQELKTSTKTSKEINKKINDLKSKYKNDDLNLLYDDVYSEDAEKRQDIRNLKQEYEYELVVNKKLEEKFKNCFRMFYFDNKYDTKDTDVNRKHFAELFNKILEDISKEQKGEKPIYKPIVKTEEDEVYYRLRRNIESDIYGDTMSFMDFENLFFDTGIFALDKTPVLIKKKLPIFQEEQELAKQKEAEAKTTTQTPPPADNPNAPAKKPKELSLLEQEINKINFNKRYVVNSLEYSISKSFKIDPMRRQKMVARYEELFGSINEMVYPEGFAHLCNYDYYCMMKPGSSMEDYRGEGNFTIYKYKFVKNNIFFEINSREIL